MPQPILQPAPFPARVARRASAPLDAETVRHLSALQVTPDAYAAWCETRGFRATFRKTARERAEEIEITRAEGMRNALAAARLRHRRPDDLLRDLHAGVALPASASDNAVWARIARGFKTLDGGKNKAERDAFLRLLLVARRHNRLLETDSPALPALCEYGDSTFVAGLCGLAREHRHWIRAPEAFRPESKNPRRQFGELARHLLARWNVPAFLDHAFWDGTGSEGARSRAWFRRVGDGLSLRAAEGLPLTLSKRAAHLLGAAAAPRDLTIWHALRWAQLRALGADEAMTRAVLATRLGADFSHEAFWGTVLLFFAQNPLLDHAQIGLITDYIHHRKFENQVIEGPGFVEQAGPINPDFSIKGRTAPALLRLAEEWRRAETTDDGRRASPSWSASGFAPLDLRETDGDGAALLWTLREIVTKRDLSAEGRAMSHCVATFARSCACGATSVWSLRVAEKGEAPRRVMTIAVQNSRRAITQARGRFNALPGATRSDRGLDRAPRLLARWAEREGLEIQRTL